MSFPKKTKVLTKTLHTVGEVTKWLREPNLDLLPRFMVKRRHTLGMRGGLSIRPAYTVHEDGMETVPPVKNSCGCLRRQAINGMHPFEELCARLEENENEGERATSYSSSSHCRTCFNCSESSTQRICLIVPPLTVRHRVNMEWWCW